MQISKLHNFHKKVLDTIHSRFVAVMFAGSLFLTLSSCTNIPPVLQGDNDWSFIVYGDLRQGFGVYEKLAVSMSQIKPTPLMAICTGDVLFKAGKEAEWINFWKYSKPITDVMPILIVRGNHEGNNKPSEWLLHKETSTPGDQPFYYSLILNNQKMIMLDTEIKGEENSISNLQLEWLKNELENASTVAEIQYIFVFMHRPLYRQGNHLGDTLQNADELHQLFLGNKKIKAVIASHDHLFHFQNKDGINYIISGGAGAELRHGYGGDYYHYLLFSISEKNSTVNMKTVGVFNEVIEDRDL